MSKTITALFAGGPALDTIERFLASEYDVPDTDLRIEPATGQSASGARQLSVDVNDDEIDEIRAALTTMGAAIPAGA